MGPAVREIVVFTVSMSMTIIARPLMTMTMVAKMASIAIGGTP